MLLKAKPHKFLKSIRKLYIRQYKENLPSLNIIFLLYTAPNGVWKIFTTFTSQSSYSVKLFWVSCQSFFVARKRNSISRIRTDPWYSFRKIGSNNLGIDLSYEYMGWEDDLTKTKWPFQKKRKSSSVQSYRTIHKTTHFWHHLQSLGFQSPPSGLLVHKKDSQNSLKVVIHTVTVYYSERRHIKKQPVEEIHGSESKKVPNKELPVILSSLSYGQYYFVMMMCDNTHRVLSTTEVCLRLMFRVFVGVWLWSWLPECLPFSTQPGLEVDLSSPATPWGSRHWTAEPHSCSHRKFHR